MPLNKISIEVVVNTDVNPGSIEQALLDAINVDTTPGVVNVDTVVEEWKTPEQETIENVLYNFTSDGYPLSSMVEALYSIINSAFDDRSNGTTEFGKATADLMTSLAHFADKIREAEKNER